MLFDRSFVSLPLNTAGRDFVVGDVHGQLMLLRRLMGWVEFDRSRDRLIAVGDLVDRGPGCAELLRMLQTEAWFISVVGNHEAMMRAALLGDHGMFVVWSQQDVRWTAGLLMGEIDELLKIVDGMPLAFELPLLDGRRVGIVHAEVRPGSSWDDVRAVESTYSALDDTSGRNLASALLWGRQRAYAGYRQRLDPEAKRLDAATRVRTWQAMQPVAGIDWVLSGHTTIIKPSVPMTVANCTFIDTASFHIDGWLTFLEPCTGRYWQVGGCRKIRRGPAVLRPAADIEPFRPTSGQEEEAACDEAERLKLLRRFT